MGVQGFAAGLRNGFDMMERYQRDQDNNDYRNRELSLRQAMLDNQNAHSDRAFRLSEKQLAQNDSHFKEQMAQNAKQAEMANKLASQRDWREQQQYNMALDDRNRALWQKDKFPIIANGYDLLNQGKDPGEPFWQAVSSEFGAPYNPMNFIDPEYAKQSAATASKLQGLISKVSNGEMSVDSPAFVTASHDPELLAGLNYMLRDELDQHLGMKDSSGKEIADQVISQIMVDPKTHKLILGFDTAYTDGSKGHDTKYGPDGHPKSYEWTDIAGPLIKRAALAKHLSSTPEHIKQVLGLSPRPDTKEMNKALNEISKAELKGVGNAMDEETAQRITDQANEARKEIRLAYGGGAAGGPASLIKQFVGGNKKRRAFINQLRASNPETFSKIIENPEGAAYLLKTFGEWEKSRSSGSKSSSNTSPVPKRVTPPKQGAGQLNSERRPSLAEAIDAYQRYPNSNPRHKQPSGPAPIEKLAKALTEAPVLNSRPDGLAAYQAMAAKR